MDRLSRNPKRPKHKIESQEELRRFEECEDAKKRLPVKIAKAQKDGVANVWLVTLDKKVSYGDFSVRKLSWDPPTHRDHLHSEAYQRLWDHCVELGLRPFVEQFNMFVEGRRCHAVTYGLSVSVPLDDADRPA